MNGYREKNNYIAGSINRQILMKFGEKYVEREFD